MAPMPSTREADVVIVGAGFSGLAAAREVIRSGGSAIVLEARDRVGGRSLNAELPGGEVIDVGGQWLGPTQDRLAAYAAEYGIERYPTHIKGSNVLEIGDTLSTYTGTIPRSRRSCSPRSTAAHAKKIDLLPC